MRYGVVALLGLLTAARAEEPRIGSAAYGDWHSDALGVVRHITVDSLPVPYATGSASQAPAILTRPAGATLHVPSGFLVKQLAAGLSAPRTLRTAPNGDVFVAESSGNRVLVLRLVDGKVRSNTVFADGFDYPYGIAFWPPGPAAQFVYVAETGRVVRFPYQAGDLTARGAAEVIVPHVPMGGNHWTRDLVFSRDGRTMFVSVGSHRDVGTQGEYERADVLAFDPDGGRRRIFASGLRNCSGEALAPTGDLWCVVNERDSLGDNLPPDYATSVREGAFYGWPWFYIGDHEEPRLMRQRRDLMGHVTVPDVLIQPHSAPLAIAFYEGGQFPAQYHGDAFVTLHGSWNRRLRTGYKVIRLRFREGKPTGQYEDFLTGFVVSDEAVWGRPVGIAVTNDGALLMSEDGNGTIWRIAWNGE
jgi:glucose/arabinose dehydrogenase